MGALRNPSLIAMSAPVKSEVALAADDNRRMFDAIARRYDLLNHLMSMGLDRRWRRDAVKRFIDSMPAGSGNRRVLDVGCGTGDVTIEVARRSGGVSVLGIDHSAKMLVLAGKKVTEAGLAERVTLQVGDAVATGAPDGAFDGVITAFCFRNISDRLAFLRETVRVLKPGCPLLILELTRPRSWGWRVLHFIYNAWTVPCLGLLLSQGSAYRYLFKSIEAFPEHEQVLSMMKDAGFEAVRWTPLTGGVVSLFEGTSGR